MSDPASGLGVPSHRRVQWIQCGGTPRHRMYGPLWPSLAVILGYLKLMAFLWAKFEPFENNLWYNGSILEHFMRRGRILWQTNPTTPP